MQRRARVLEEYVVMHARDKLRHALKGELDE